MIIIKMQEIKKENQSAFTIIELIVVIAVFLLVVGSAIGIFISIIQSQKRILSEQELINQISYTEEYMSKALRMAKSQENENCLLDSQGVPLSGFIYLLTRYDINSGLYKGIKFINQSDTDLSGNPTCQEFFWDADGLLKEEKNNGSPVALMSSNLKINSIKFAINGSDGSGRYCPAPSQCGASDKDAVQPRVTIFFNINIPGQAARTIQTTVSQRNLNINNGQR